MSRFQLFAASPARIMQPALGMAGFLALVAAASLLAAILLAPAQALAQDRRIVVIEDADYFGSDFRTVPDVDLEACKTACLDDSQCKAFTYNTSAGWCFLKSDFGDLQSFSGAVAGRVVLVQPPLDPQEGEKRRAELNYLPHSLRDEADRFQKGLDTRYSQDTRGVDALIGEAENLAASGRHEDAEQIFGRAARIAPENYRIWIGLAASALEATPEDWQKRQVLQETATSAAMNAYLRASATEDQVRALRILAKGLGERYLWKPAIRSYRAALALREEPALRATYEDMIAQHGFRILSHQVDSDSVRPRICLVFSERLNLAVPTLADFVKVTNSDDMSVEVEESQICVDGVRHGARYEITVRPGLPSADGEQIEKSVDLAVYVRDRAPGVRFVGRAYVLPRGNNPTIPIVSVNTSKIETEIFRISDRSVATAIRDGEFLDQLNSYREDQLRDETGRSVWKGIVEVEDSLNADVTTAVPLKDIGIELRPGAYVMTARPSDDTRNRWGTRATQWFVVSDLGLTSYTGRDGLHVMVRSLDSAKARADVQLQLVATNNEILGEGTSDEQGYFRFAPGLSRGIGGSRPAVLMARGSDGDYAFLDLTKSSFDLADRGVEGRPAPGPLDVFAFTERGVYRPGATVHAVALSRDANVQAVPTVPLTFIFSRPDGVEHRRVVSADGGLGGHAVDLELSPTSAQGTWSLAVHADPEAPALARQTFLVEDFQPERVAFELETAADFAVPDEPVGVSVEARYLYGAPAGGHRLEGDVRVSATRTWGDSFKGYLFGLAEEESYPGSSTLPSDLKTDADGLLSFEAALPEIPGDTQLAEVTIIARLVDAGGRFVERTRSLPVAPETPRIGIRPLFEDAVPEGGPAEFDVIMVAPGGDQVAATGLEWTLSKLETDYQWYRVDGNWQFDAVSTKRRVDAGTIDLGSTDPLRITVPVQWGRYRLEIVAGGDTPTASSVEFNAGLYVASASAETPDALEVGLDKDAYAPGETARLRLSPRFPGTAIVAVMADGLVTTRTVEVPQAGEMTVDLPVTEDWGAGAYVTASLYRPMDIEAGRMPTRALGLEWLSVEPGDRRLDVQLDAPSQMRPRQTLSVPVRLANLAEGEEAYITLAAVDVGILNLTRYEEPKPDDWYFGQRALGMEIRDLYGQLIDRTLGTRGKVRAGGDGGGLQMQGPPPTEKPVALFSGIIRVDASGQATVTFEVPDFNGTLRLMAVAWSATGVGHASEDVVVRDPVVLGVSLPKFLAPGDASRLLVEVDNVDGPAGTYELSFEQTDEIAILASDTERFIELAQKERRAVRIPIEGRLVGDAEITLVLNGPTDAAGAPSQAMAAKALTLGVRDNQPPQTLRRVVSLPPGGNLHLSASMVTGVRPAASTVSVSANAAARINVAALLAGLDRYPYGCTEQLTSRALPLIYMSNVAEAAGLGEIEDLRNRVDNAIGGVLANQSSEGGFGVWNSYGGNTLWLDAYTTDFLTRAREDDHFVPAIAYEQALDNLANRVAYSADFDGGGEDVAYALNVLARAGRASIGDLRYFADARLERFGSAMARAQLGAALASYGERERAQRAFASAADLLGEKIDGPEEGYREDYGSTLRDAASLVAMATEAKLPGLPVDLYVDLLERAQEKRGEPSTQDMAWMLLAANGLFTLNADTKVTLDGRPMGAPAARIFNGAALIAQPSQLTNEGMEPIDVVTSVTGPATSRPVQSESRGYTITREIYDMDGKLLGSEAVAQNTRVVVVLRIQALDDEAARLLVVDRLPAGLEIENPRLLRSGDVGALDWLDLSSSTENAEFRDDRFVVAFNRSRGDNRNASFAYLVRAVTPGSYEHPSASIEDMYRPEREARTAGARFEVIGPNR